MDDAPCAPDSILDPARAPDLGAGTLPLLAWYDRERRDLPWRSRNDAYAIWLSEVMAQQTRVDVVIPYWHRFLERFPRVEDLAAAPVEEVLALWSGLGYYRRARQLHAAAGRVVAAGGFPDTVEGLRELPGIGEYTAAAVASIAFGVDVPVLDGNVERVTTRLLAEPRPPRRAAVRRRLRGAAAALVDPERPGDSNQALMELGATVCTPKDPRCDACPLEPLCEAAHRGEQELYPARRERRAPRRVVQLVAVVEEDGRQLLFRRPDDAELLAGMWELPWVEVVDGDGGGGRADDLPHRDDPTACEVALGRRYGGSWSLEGRLGSARHAITHRAIELDVRRARVATMAGTTVADGPGEAGWFGAEERRLLGVSSLVEKALAVAADA